MNDHCSALRPARVLPVLYFLPTSSSARSLSVSRALGGVVEYLNTVLGMIFCYLNVISIASAVQRLETGKVGHVSLSKFE